MIDVRLIGRHNHKEHAFLNHLHADHDSKFLDYDKELSRVNCNIKYSHQTGY